MKPMRAAEVAAFLPACPAAIQLRCEPRARWLWWRLSRPRAPCSSGGAPPGRSLRVAFPQALKRLPVTSRATPWIYHTSSLARNAMAARSPGNVVVASSRARRQSPPRRRQDRPARPTAIATTPMDALPTAAPTAPAFTSASAWAQAVRRAVRARRPAAGTSSPAAIRFAGGIRGPTWLRARRIRSRAPRAARTRPATRAMTATVP
jgi:hypothetical protein